MLRLRRIDREWLLATHVLAILKAQQYVFVVVAVRRSDVDDVHVCILDQFVVGAVAARLRRLGLRAEVELLHELAGARGGGGGGYGCDAVCHVAYVARGGGDE